MILPNASQMRAIDQCAINHFGVPGIVLMENAGLGTVLMIERMYGPLQDASIPIFIGPGNNGGDGLVIARHLLQRKARPLLVFLIDPDTLKGDSATNLAIVRKLDLPLVICNNSKSVSDTLGFLRDVASRFGPPLVLVDAIFGTGLCRPIEKHFRKIIDLVNHMSGTGNIPIIAVDTPSGLDSDSGSILGTCIEARATATYGYAKIGQLMANSGRYTGALHVIDIGLPEGVSEHVPVSVHSIDLFCVNQWMDQLKRGIDSHKGSYGHLLIVAGSAGKTGAALLAGRGALRSGCGLVSLCCSEDLNAIYESASAEIMTIPLASQSAFNTEDLDLIRSHARGKDCIVLGPGIGQEPSTAELVIELYNNCPVPMVVDADGLNIIAAHRDQLLTPPSARILTPHPGEMARLIKQPASSVQANRINALQQCVELFSASDCETIVILKGAATLVSGDDLIGVNTTGNPAMAAGGMGDVLSGIIGSLVCQGMAPYSASCFGVYLHGLCGDRLFDNSGIGFTPSELADELGGAFQALQKDCV